MRKRKLFFIVPLAILGILLFLAIGGAVVQSLWNWLLPSLFGWHAVTFWQALGLLVLCRILFGGSGRHGFRRPGWRRHLGERCGNMTPEERERFRQGIRERWGFDPSPGESQGQ
jgi:hypothetical protein